MKKLIVFHISVFYVLSSCNLSGQAKDSLFIYEAPYNVSSFDSTNTPNLLENNSDTLTPLPVKKSLSHQIAGMFVVPDKSKVTAPKDQKYGRINYFNAYNDKIIRKISIIQLQVFGPSVLDTNLKPKHWFEKLGNNLHISTNKSSIRNHLFISENERIDAFIFADNERILRELPSIQDARIYVLPVKGSPDSVDIQVVTKDVWPVGFGFEVLDIDYGSVSAWNNNILGLGHVLNYTGYYNYNREPKYGYTARYRIPNIGSRFISLDLRHDDRWNYMANKINLSRNIISPVIRFGGGIDYEKVDQIRNIQTFDTLLKDVSSSYEYYDLWAGYAFPIKRSFNFKVRKSFFISAREQKIHYFTRPQVESDFLYPYQQNRRTQT